jgi:glycosyltransferase involved in cell wall biosynthesis
MTKISVIVPVYNSANTLAQCLAAVAASDDPHFECLVVDDGSTDDSRTIARQFPVRLLELAGGPFGPAYARNRGAEAASGEILLFVDADVVICPDTLSGMAKRLRDQPEIDAVFGSYDDSPAAGNFISQYKNLFHHFFHQQGREQAETFWAGCGAVRRRVFFEVGGFDERRYPRPCIEDIELGYRLTGAGHRVVLSKQVQVKHLKQWTLRSMIKSDVVDRGIPWTLLILQTRALPSDLNLSLSQRVSAALLYGMLVYLGVGAIFQVLAVAPLLLLLFLILLLNHRLYAFFIRKRGMVFALAVVPFHLFYYFYSGLAFALGIGLYLGSRPPWRAD